MRPLHDDYDNVLALCPTRYKAYVVIKKLMYNNQKTM